MKYFTRKPYPAKNSELPVPKKANANPGLKRRRGLDESKF